MPEKMIAELCSPTLSGSKCANRINCEYESKERLNHDVLDMNRRLSGKGLHMMVLSYPCKNRALIYIFRPCMLQKELNLPENRSLMEKLGYEDARIGCCLNQLRQKLTEHTEFPHEIGCFLGYPTEDVIGFMKHEKCCYHGVWKVYGNVEKAKELFARYESCTRKCMDLFEKGVPIEEIAVSDERG